MTDSLKKQILELTESVLSDTEFFVVDIEIKGGKELSIWLYVDGIERNINMDECAEISKELGFLLEAHDLVSRNYRLNVSSPGLSRPLSDRRQYPKNEGRKMRVKYKKNDEYIKIEGKLAEITEQHIVVNPADEEPQTIVFDDIVEAKIIPSLK